MNGHIELLKYFLGKLPEADIKNIYGKTPLDLAQKEEIKTCLQKYIEKKENVYHKIKIHNTTETTVKNMMRNFSPKQETNNNVLVQKTQNNININIQTNINNSNSDNGITNTEGNEKIKSNMKKSNTSQTAFIVNTTNKLLKHLSTNTTLQTKPKGNNTHNHNTLNINIKQKPSTVSSNISNDSNSSNFSLHSQFSNRKKSTNKILNSSEKNITNGNLHKTKTLQKFTINNPFLKGLKTNKNISSKKVNIPLSEKKQNITNNSINITSTSIDTSLSRLNKTEDNNIKKSKQNPTNIECDNCLDSIEEERITPTSFICLALLGRGSFGEVYLVQKINTGSLYAMKVLSKDRIMGQNLLKYAMAERNVLSLSNHPFIK